MKKLISILILLISFETLPSQVTQEWVSRYNGPGNSSDGVSSIAVDGSGNVYVTGGSEAGSGTNYDYATIKYNSSGDSVWVKRYNGPGNSLDFALSIAVDGSANVYVTGSSAGSGTDYDYATIKYNSSGVQQWVQRYDGPGSSIDDGALSIAVDISGNVYVTGYSYSGGSDYDYATIKYNSSGVQQWAAKYNSPGNSFDYANSIAVDGSGNVYVTGYSATIKYNSSGDSVWVKRDSSGGANSIALDGLGNVYVTGYSVAGSGTTAIDYATIKYNSSGVQQWVARYNGPLNYSEDRATSIAVDISGNIYVTGSSGTGAIDYATIKYNSSGVQQWVARYNGPGNSSDYAHSIALDGSGNVYVTGSGFGSGTGSDYATIKYNSSGDSVWVQRYNGPPGTSQDLATEIAIDGSGNVYVAGSSLGIGSNNDYATIKYSQTIGISQISSIIPEQFSLEQNYPNPFNPNTNLEFGISKLEFISLKVYDALGKEVATLVNASLSPGTYTVEFDGSNLTSGVYFYRIETESFTETKRMLLIK